MSLIVAVESDYIPKSMNAGKIILEWRDKKGWTQDDLARESGVGRSTIQNFERGKVPARHTILALLVAMGKTIEEYDDIVEGKRIILAIVGEMAERISAIAGYDPRPWIYETIENAIRSNSAKIDVVMLDHAASASATKTNKSRLPDIREERDGKRQSGKGKSH